MTKKNGNGAKGAAQINSLNAKVRGIKAEITPTLTHRPIRQPPKPLRPFKEVYIPRTIRVYANQASASANVVVTVGKLLTDADIGGQVTLRVREVKAWNMTKASDNSNYIQLTSSVALTTEGISLVSEDVGNPMSMAATSIRIPHALSKGISASNSSSVNICVVNALVPNGNAPTNQVICVDVLIEIKTDNAV